MPFNSFNDNERESCFPQDTGQTEEVPAVKGGTTGFLPFFFFLWTYCFPLECQHSQHLDWLFSKGCSVLTVQILCSIKTHGGSDHLINDQLLWGQPCYNNQCHNEVAAPNPLMGEGCVVICALAIQIFPEFTAASATHTVEGTFVTGESLPQCTQDNRNEVCVFRGSKAMGTTAKPFSGCRTGSQNRGIYFKWKSVCKLPCFVQFLK